MKIKDPIKSILNKLFKSTGWNLFIWGELDLGQHLEENLYDGIEISFNICENNAIYIQIYCFNSDHINKNE